MKTVLIIFLFFYALSINAQNSFTSRNELKSSICGTSIFVFSYDELGNMKTRNVSIISGSTDIVNEFVSIQHIPTDAEVQIAISDGTDGKLVKVFNSKNELVWEYSGNTARSNLKSLTSNTIVIDVSDFEKGIYYVNVFDEVGAQLARKQFEISGSTGIDFNAIASSIRIFPNPTNGKLTIDFGETLDFKTEIKVIDVLGRLVYSVTNTELTNSRTISLDNLNLGQYIIVIQTEKMIIKQEKIILTK